MVTPEYTSLLAEQNGPVLDFSDAGFDASLSGI
jgi:hypothetical protein